MPDFNQVEQLRKFEDRLIQCILKVEAANSCRTIFTKPGEEIDTSAGHDWDAPGDIYGTFDAIKKAVISEYRRDLEDVRSQIERILTEF